LAQGRILTRVAYGVSQLPRVVWYLGHGLALRRFGEAAQRSDALREPPRLFGVEPPKPRIEAVRVVDMSASNSWAEFAGLYHSTRQAFLDHERSKAELKALMPEDAKEATGHGIRAKRSKSGAISFDIEGGEGNHAALE
jgi:hypothetical protein